MLDAIRVVASANTRPVTSVPIAAPNALQELDVQWDREVTTPFLDPEGGEFLMTLAESGDSERGWAHVKDAIGNGLPSRVNAVTGTPEFIALSTDGRRMYTVSEEEQDYWVLVHEFS